MGRARGKPVDDDRHAGDRGGGDAGATRPGRAGYVPMRCPGICQCLYQDAGLREVAGRDVGAELVTDSPAQYREMISEHVSLASCGACAGGRAARERIAKAVIAKAPPRTRRQGEDSGRGPLHRRHEVATPGLERLRTVAEPRSSSWQPEIVGARLTSPGCARLTLCDRSCSIVERTLPQFGVVVSTVPVTMLGVQNRASCAPLWGADSVG